MNPTDALTEFLKEQGVFFYAPLPFSKATVFPQKLSRVRLPFAPATVWFFLVPYYACDGENISAYATGHDYHLWAKQFEQKLLPHLRAAMPSASFALFCDNSPINERSGAAACGLGTLGDHGLLIHPLYGTYVFIGEVISDADAASFPAALPIIEETCTHCGGCRAACPGGVLSGDGDGCLSALTQKKGELTKEEAALLRRQGSAWGCDICQEVCPFNQRARQRGTLTTPIPFFHENLLPKLTYEAVEQMTEEAFSCRAYGWRGKETVLRNLRLLEDGELY